MSAKQTSALFEVTNTATREACRGVFYTADECHTYARCQGFAAYVISKDGKVVETVGPA